MKSIEDLEALIRPCIVEYLQKTRGPICVEDITNSDEYVALMELIKAAKLVEDFSDVKSTSVGEYCSCRYHLAKAKRMLGKYAGSL